MSPVFSPPTADLAPPLSEDYRAREPFTGANLTRVGRALFRHYANRPVGRTLIRVGGVYSLHDNPEQSLLDTASEVYLGGHLYVVDDATAAALAAAGYSVGEGVFPATDLYPSTSLFPAS